MRQPLRSSRPIRPWRAARWATTVIASFAGLGFALASRGVGGWLFVTAVVVTGAVAWGMFPSPGARAGGGTVGQ
ncbi:hypothetical protein LX16_4648 [Stackebrandtia albiflava]|uniref:Uncharacterized protein n=1 Tax=Stackebrandtia albiflava TaxID=406432 RepID=A0A562UQI9_9ACTN|nr:hypothetical protein LX16_4648 [Stackebrandtia albiflava]